MYTQKNPSQKRPDCVGSRAGSSRNLFRVIWTLLCEITGPTETCYEGGLFSETLLPLEYPMCAPKIRFLTKIFVTTSTRSVEFVWTFERQMVSCVTNSNCSSKVSNSTLLHPDDPLNNVAADMWKWLKSAIKMRKIGQAPPSMIL